MKNTVWRSAAESYYKVANLPFMETELDIKSLVRNMQPRLDSKPFVFCQLAEEVWRGLQVAPIGLFREDEGWTALLEENEAKKEGLTYQGVWAHIVLEVYSDLDAVGFLAKIASALAEKAIPVNPVSAFHHDHLFVPWALRHTTLEVLNSMIGSYSPTSN